MRAAVKGLMLCGSRRLRLSWFPVIFQGFPVSFSQLLYCLRVVCADTAHAGTADFIKRSLVCPAIPGNCCRGLRSAFSFLPCGGEVRAAAMRIEGTRASISATFVHVRRQFSGVGVKAGCRFSRWYIGSTGVSAVLQAVRLHLHNACIPLLRCLLLIIGKAVCVLHVWRQLR